MKFLLKRASNGQYLFNLSSDNGEILLSSEFYRSLESAKNGINSVIANAGNIDHYQTSETNNGKYHFQLRASNGQIIGQSPLYNSKKSVTSAAIFKVVVA